MKAREKPLTRPPFETIYMELAANLSLRSTCRRLGVGCAIVSADFQRVLSIGYNGNAAGLPNDCDSEEPGACGCFISGTSVTASGVTKAYRRRYEGEVVRVVTTTGEFTATPNHPVLAAGHGWVPVQNLREGDHLLRSVWSQEMPTSAPHDYKGVPIEQIFESVRVASRMVRRAGTRHDFHGDGRVDQEVDVVSIYGGLSSHGEPVLLEEGSKPGFSAALRVKSALGSLRAVAEFVGRPFGHKSGFDQSMPDNDDADTKRPGDRESSFASLVAAYDVFKRKFNHRLSLVPAEILGTLAKNPEFSKAALDGRVGNPMGGSDVEDRFSGPVAVSKVLVVEKKAWSGHVYNLETKNNWYSVGEDAVVAHNCLHAEDNAIIKCREPSTTPKIVFCTHLPCKACAKRIINLGGVKKVIYLNDYRIKDSIQLLRFVEVDIVQYDRSQDKETVA